jgi:hypothetical protein
MKIIFLMFAMTIYFAHSQKITIDVFEVQEYYVSDSVSVEIAIAESKMISDKIPVRYSYVIDFNSKTCKVYTGSALISSTFFKLVSRNATDFHITLEGSPNEIGLYVNGEIAAFYERFRSTDVSLFTSYEINH